MSLPILATILAITLVPPALAEGDRVLDMDEMVVTPGRIEQRLSEVPRNVTVLTSEDLARSAPRRVDDLLRQVPGFSLFRRASSRVAQPTTQGVTLRGIAPSGVSRTLVLLDGVPMNDPFGGWVYWSRIPREALERVEIVRGGGSEPWGSAALGGVIHLRTVDPRERMVRASLSGGTRETLDGELLAADVLGPLRLAFGGHGFRTDGYPVLRADLRGPIDENAFTEDGSLRGRAVVQVADGVEASLGGSVFRERRGNGTPLTGNETAAATVDGGLAAETAFGTVAARAYSQLQTFESTFSAQESDRSEETPALDQFDVPSTAVGTSFQWSSPERGGHRLAAGLDSRFVDGETRERFFFSEGSFRNLREAGGEEWLVGLWARDVYDVLPELQLTGGVRVDLWRSVDRFRTERVIATGEVRRDDRFGDRDEVAVSPGLGARYVLGERFSLRGAFYRSFRAPTLNELVRPFRVRNDITEANARLDPERLTGGEIGLDWSMPRALGRLTGFWNEVRDPIGNVTVGDGPGTVEPCGFVPEGGVCRQRRNLGKTRIRGVEAELTMGLPGGWLVGASTLASDAEVIRSPEQPALEGKQLAQVPELEAAGRLEWADPGLGAAAVQLRWVGDQFEDDRNELRLEDFVVVDLFAGWAVRPGWELFLAIENLFDETFEVGRTADGLVTIGAPRLVQGGLRVRL